MRAVTTLGGLCIHAELTEDERSPIRMLGPFGRDTESYVGHRSWCLGRSETNEGVMRIGPKAMGRRHTQGR